MIWRRLYLERGFAFRVLDLCTTIVELCRDSKLNITTKYFDPYTNVEPADVEQAAIPRKPAPQISKIPMQ